MRLSNSSGKVLIIFLVITAILLVSLTAIALFFFQRETERRKTAEATLLEYQNEKTDLEIKLKEVEKQNFLLQEKNKEVDELVNDISDELELQKGLREEIKIENDALQKQLAALKAEKDSLAQKLEENKGQEGRLSKDLAASEQKIKELQAQLQAEVERSQKLGEMYEQQETEFKKLKEARAQMSAVEQQFTGDPPAEPRPNEPQEPVTSKGVELDEIIIDPNKPPVFTYEDTPTIMDHPLSGRILSIDTETEFVIVDLGTRDGLSIGNVLSVYRNDDYMGDIKITRLQSEMSAADLIRPLTISKVRKNDLVKAK